ncbi:MAG: Strongly-conserved Zn-finger binding protein (TFIIIA) [Sclerophora amabilis]|nr:MAG: Strongly-conserved Zn-finger binding protein (TFIIIA) [Sclerophora amabilis]
MPFDTKRLPLARAKRTRVEEKEMCLKRRLNLPAERQPSDGDFSDGDSDDTDLADDLAAGKPVTSTPLTPVSPRRKFPSEQKTHHCTYDGCEKSFNRPARLAEHMRSHTNDRAFKCSYDSCGKTFLRDTHLSHHVKSAHIGVRDYSCQWPGCGKKFLTGTRLRRHQAVHEGKEKYRCTDCNENFRKHSTLQRHITSVHLHQKPFPCTHINPTTSEKCAQEFDTAGKLRAHEGRIHGGLRFWCTECPSSDTGQPSSTDVTASTPPPKSAHGIGFPTYALLQSHLRMAHPPTCAICNKVCSARRELRQHIELHHGDDQNHAAKPHACPHPSCGRSFAKKGNLTVHQRTVHLATRPFICSPDADLSSFRDCGDWTAADACGRAFKTKATLEGHVRNVHLQLATGSSKRSLSQPNWTPKPSSSSGRMNPPPRSAIDLLTGAGYTSDPTRRKACFFEAGGPGGIAPCPHRFARKYDVDIHMRSRHGLAQREVSALRAEREMSSGGKFWVGGIDDDECEQGPGQVDSEPEDRELGGCHGWGEYEDSDTEEEEAFDRFLSMGDDAGTRGPGGRRGADRMKRVEKGDGSEAVIDPALLHMQV